MLSHPAVALSPLASLAFSRAVPCPLARSRPSSSCSSSRRAARRPPLPQSRRPRRTSHPPPPLPLPPLFLSIRSTFTSAGLGQRAWFHSRSFTKGLIFATTDHSPAPALETSLIPLSISPLSPRHVRRYKIHASQGSKTCAAGACARRQQSFPGLRQRPGHTHPTRNVQTLRLSSTSA